MLPETGDEIGHRLPDSAALYQMRILGKIKSIDPFTLGHHVSTQLLCPAPSARMGDEDCVCERGREMIALLSQRSCGSPMLWGERRQDEQTALGYPCAPGGWESHPFDAAGRADYYRLCTAQQQLQAFLLHG
jgi:hypothetical protein